jgi:hypothetical protein
MMSIEEAERALEVEMAQARTVTEIDAVLHEYLRRVALARETAEIDRAVARDREHSTGELNLAEEGDTDA